MLGDAQRVGKRQQVAPSSAILVARHRINIQRAAQPQRARGVALFIAAMPPHARIVHGEGVFPAGRLFRLLGSALALAATPTTATIAATVTSTTTASSTRGRGLFCLGAGGAGFAPCIHGRGCSGRSSKSGHNRRLHTRLHRLQARRLVQIVKVFTVTGWQPLGPAREHGQPLHSLGSGFGLFAAGVAACAGLRGAVIVPTHGQQGSRQQ